MQHLRRIFLALLMTIVALLPGIAIAQTPQPQQPSVVAIGTGEATAPAATVTVQLLLGSAMNFGMGPMMGVVEEGPGTPAAMGPGAMGVPAEVSEESLAPVVQALIGAGVTEDAITMTVPAPTDAFGFGGPEIGEMLIELGQESGVQIEEASPPHAKARRPPAWSSFTREPCSSLPIA
ncbi:MAG: hypothetical protein AB7V46_02250 [Thermomicrobiales bacterium]